LPCFVVYNNPKLWKKETPDSCVFTLKYISWQTSVMIIIWFFPLKENLCLKGRWKCLLASSIWLQITKVTNTSNFLTYRKASFLKLQVFEGSTNLFERNVIWSNKPSQNKIPQLTFSCNKTGFQIIIFLRKNQAIECYELQKDKKRLKLHFNYIFIITKHVRYFRQYGIGDLKI